MLTLPGLQGRVGKKGTFVSCCGMYSSCGGAMYRYSPRRAGSLSAQISKSPSAATKPARLPAPLFACLSTPFVFTPRARLPHREANLQSGGCRLYGHTRTKMTDYCIVPLANEKSQKYWLIATDGNTLQCILVACACTRYHVTWWC